MGTIRTKKRIAQRSQRLPKGQNGGVQLLLIQSVEHLGRQGEVVEVKLGYATNYLIPQGLATVATEHHVRMVDKHKAKLAEIQRQRLVGLETLSKELGEQSVTIEATANEEGHLYGSVAAPEIAAALKALNFDIKSEQVRLEGPLKETGLYTVKLHLGHEIDAEVKVWVVPTVSDE
jgi:large subunit ribosomal protein L9